MKYMLLLYSNESEIPQTPEEQQAAAPAWYAFMQEVQAAGVWVSNHGLSPVATATTVRVREGKTLTTDGPFAETHEQLGGYYVLDCPDLDEAIRWAAKIPSVTYGSIEIRPLNHWSQ
ncbi:MAG TPA: YciI family protein [Aggregatilineaceae bacterium]|nr:YciI family protein [Aggregatilineaceae bacterium]